MTKTMRRRNWHHNLKILVASIREHHADASLLLFFAAGSIGVGTQVLHPAHAGSEMVRLAKNLAEHGTFANPFGSLATGLTAVNPPLYPFIRAGLMKVLRHENLTFFAALLGSILANAITAALLPRVSFEFYEDVIPGMVASVLWLAAMQTMPGWDTSFTIAGLLYFCLLTSSSVAPGAGKGKAAVLAGVAFGLLFLLNPSSLLVALPWFGFLIWRAKADLGLHRSVTYCCITMTVFCLFVFAWCGRNYYKLGAFVVRTNLGMTLYASNNNCAQSSMFRDQLNGCYQAHHPDVSVREAELLRDLGEVQYDRHRIADTKKWIKTNPTRFLELTRARLREFWFPATEVVPAGSFAPDDMVEARNWLKEQNRIAYVFWFVTGLSFPGFILMLRRREPVTVFALIALAIYPLMYYTVVSDMRYRYPVLWLSLLGAGYFVGRVLTAMTETPGHRKGTTVILEL
jgi:hypothetical protein